MPQRKTHRQKVECLIFNRQCFGCSLMMNGRDRFPGFGNHSRGRFDTDNLIRAVEYLRESAGDWAGSRCDIDNLHVGGYARAQQCLTPIGFAGAEPPPLRDPFIMRRRPVEYTAQERLFFRSVGVVGTNDIWLPLVCHNQSKKFE